jgi:acyl carrier protein phosphodiesterase
MNFLAHLYLSGDNAKIMVGNFIGDFVKGRNLSSQFEPEIVRGIEMHRAIDAFTDTHSVVRLSKKRLHGKYRHYSPVIVDVFYDHFLARYWDQYHPNPLPVFADNAYKTIDSYHTILPSDVQHMLPYMIRGNWLVNYAQIEGIHRALTGISRRTTHVSHMDESINDLREHYDLFKQEFEEFFPTLKAHVSGF